MKLKLINEAKEDKYMKKELPNVMQGSKDSFKETMDGMSGAMIQVAQGFTRSMELLLSIFTCRTAANE